MYSKEKDAVIIDKKMKKGEVLLRVLGISGVIIILLALYDFFIAKDKEILNKDFLTFLSIELLISLPLIFFIIIIPKFIKRIKKNLKIGFVNSTTDFDNVYKQLKLKYRDNLVKERNKTILKSFGILVWTISFIAFYIFFYIELAKFSENYSSNGLYVLLLYVVVLSSIAFAIYGLIKLWIKKQEIIENYATKYKTAIISGIAECVELDAKYKIEGTISEEEYGNTKIENEKFDVFESKNSIVMWNEKIKINKLSVKKWIAFDGKARIRTMFEGVFVIFKTDKEFKNKIEIRTKKVKNRLKENFIPMNSTDFEDIFKVYSSSIEFAKETINEKMMKIIVGYYEKYKINFDLFFDGGEIYMKIYTDEVFEPAVYERIPNKERTLRNYTFIKFIKELCVTLEENI